MGCLGFIVTDGSPKFRKSFDAIIPDWQFAGCESDVPSLSRPYRFVERGVSLGAVAIEQGDHLFFSSRHAKGSDVLHRTGSQCQMREKKPAPASRREELSRERRAINWSQPKTARHLSPKR